MKMGGTSQLPTALHSLLPNCINIKQRGLQSGLVALVFFSLDVNLKIQQNQPQRPTLHPSQPGSTASSNDKHQQLHMKNQRQS